MKNRKIRWPNEKELKQMDRKLARVAGAKTLPPDADQLDQIKYNLCQQLVKYCLEHKLSQRELAKILEVSESRVSEIVHYHIDKLTIDRLVKHLSKLNQKVKILVA